MEAQEKERKRVEEQRYTEKRADLVDNNDELLDKVIEEGKKQHGKVSARSYEKFIRAKKEHESIQNRIKPLIKAISIALSLALVIMAFEWKTFDNGSEVTLGNLANQDFEEMVDVPLTEQPPPPPPKLVQPEITEVTDEVVIEEEIPIDLDIEVTEEYVVEEVDYSAFETEVEEETTDEIFLIVEEQPEPVGGMEAFYKYVSENLRYPNRALDMNIEGRVFVQFVVNKDGSLTNVKVVKGIGGGCDEEAARIIENAPKWKPGKQRGNPVRVRMILPIHFKLMK